MQFSIEHRLRALETKVSAMEERRRRLIDAGLDGNANVQTVLRDGMDACTVKMRLFAEQKGVDAAVTRFNVAREEPYREMERLAKDGEQKKLAEIVAGLSITSGPANRRRAMASAVKTVALRGSILSVIACAC